MIGHILDRLMDEVRRIWCYRWLAATVSGVVLVVSVTYALTTPSTYEAWGQIYVSRETPTTAAAQGVSLVGEAYGSPYVIQKTLLNEANLEKVVRRLEPGEPPLTRAELAEAMTRLRQRIRIPPDTGDGFTEIHYSDPDPARAEAVVRLLLTQFIGDNLQRSQRDLERAGGFLDEQIETHARLVEQSQAQLADFRRRRIPSGYGAEPTPELVSVPESYESGPAPAPPPSAAAQRVTQLQGKLEQLLTAYTEQHPDVIVTRRQVAEAEAEAAAEPPPVAAPAARRMVRTWRPRAAPTLPPEVAAEWAELQRRDQLVRANYEQLLAKRAATTVSQAVYSSDRAGKYQVTREPEVPTAPAGPDRRLYLGAGLLLALLSGPTVAYLWAAVRGVMVSPREVEDVIQLPVIGTVSWEPAWLSRPQFSAYARDRRPAPRAPLLLNLRTGNAR
jgi:uncharacterized protein involved in exopolysaccharide biosynthesis